jgi:hypothetical protein
VVVIQVSTIIAMCMPKGTPLSHHSSLHEYIPALRRCDKMNYTSPHTRSDAFRYLP